MRCSEENNLRQSDLLQDTGAGLKALSQYYLVNSLRLLCCGIATIGIRQKYRQLYVVQTIQKYLQKVHSRSKTLHLG